MTVINEIVDSGISDLKTTPFANGGRGGF